MYVYQGRKKLPDETASFNLMYVNDTLFIVMYVSVTLLIVMYVSAQPALNMKEPDTMEAWKNVNMGWLGSTWTFFVSQSGSYLLTNGIDEKTWERHHYALGHTPGWLHNYKIWNGG